MTRAERIAEAVRLHGEGLVDREIGERLGVDTSTVWKWRNPERAKEMARKSNAGRTPQKRAWAHANRAPCPKCGGLLGVSAKRKETKRCASCYAEETAEFRRAIIDGYRDRKPAQQIAVETGRSVYSVRTEACRLRAQGLDVPLNHWWEQAA